MTENKPTTNTDLSGTEDLTSSALKDLNITLDSLPALLIEVDREGKIYEYRAPRERLPFITSSSERPASVTEILSNNPALVMMDALAEAAENGKRAVATSPVRTDVGICWMEVSVTSQNLEPPDNRFTVLIQDITERKRIEKEKSNLEDNIRQEEKMESIGRLAGGVAHDMNNILGVVMGLASTLVMDTELSSSSQEDIEQITLACKKGIELTSRLTSLSSEVSFNKEHLSLNNLVRDAGELFARAIAEHINIKTTLDPECADVIGDPVVINHVLINLALNAADAMPVRGTITFTTKNYFPEEEEFADPPSLLPGRYVMLQVSDTGEGMSEAVMKRVFEPFFSTKSTGKGSGLGLPMVYGMIKGLGGNISLESVVGQGTTVTVLLPAYVTEDEIVEAEDKNKSVPPFARKCLVVDDNDMVLFAHLRLLKQLGYTVISAQNGQDAVKLYEEHGKDISFVLLDLVMPVMDGAQTFKLLKEMDPGVKVLLCTGYSHQKIISDLLEQGALGVLKKPFEVSQLSDELDKIFPT